MLYKGYMSNIAVNEKETRKIIMKRLLKKITYVVKILDYKELTGQVHVSISGMATKMLLFKGSGDLPVEGVLDILGQKIEYTK